MFVQSSFKHINRHRFNDLLGEPVPVTHYSLAKKVAAAQQLRSVLEQFVTMSSKLSAFHSTEEFLWVNALKTV